MNETTLERETHEEDFSWVKEFKEGNKDAFNWLVLKHKKRIFNICYRFMGAYEDANDCAQEVFIKMYHSLYKFKLEAKFTTWLYRVAINTCMNKVTSRSYKQSQRNQSLDAGVGETLGDSSFHPEQDLHRKKQQQQIQDCIRKLPEKFRAVVVLRDIDGLVYEEITQVVQQTLGTVKSRIARARKQLRTCLQGIL